MGKITGAIYGEESYEIFGNWAKEIYYKNENQNESVRIWEFRGDYDNWEEMYQFTDFTLQLNILTEEMKEHLPSTDWRFRMDQRYLEEGDLDKAGNEKFRLEEKQRRRRKRNQKDKIIPKPLYFKEVKDEIEENLVSYISNGKYWEDKEKGQWDELPDLFGADTPENSDID